MEFQEIISRQPPILVVDDLGSARKIIMKFLGKLGFTDISEASDGADAFEKFKDRSFEIVISDWEMPKLNGVELFKKLCEAQKKPRAFIMVTSRSVKGQVLEAMEAGVSDYVLKPFDENILRTKIMNVLARDVQ